MTIPIPTGSVIGLALMIAAFTVVSAWGRPSRRSI